MNLEAKPEVIDYIIELKQENNTFRERLIQIHGILARYKHDPFYDANECISDALAEIAKIEKERKV